MGRLVYFMVCDECDETLRAVGEEQYEPHFVDGPPAGGGISPQPA